MRRSPGPVTQRSIGRLGAAACTMRSQHAHASLIRTCRITSNRDGMRSNTSETSSPNLCSSPPQSGHAFCFGRWVRISRGRCAGSGRRAGRETGSTLAICSGIAATVSASLICRASSRSSSCSICRSSFSEERLNCMRRSLAINHFNCSISLSRDTISSCCETISASSSWGPSLPDSVEPDSRCSLPQTISHFFYSMMNTLRKQQNLFAHTAICGS